MHAIGGFLTICRVTGVGASRIRVALMVFLGLWCSVICCHTAVAANWTGGANNGLWNSGANWDTNTPPAGGESLFFEISNAPLILNNNVPIADLPLSGITFNSLGGGASAFTINGNRITLNGDITDNEATNAEVINLPMVLGVSPNVNVVGGGNLTLGGVVSGATFGLTKLGTGTLRLTGTNTYNGPTVIGNASGDGGAVVVSGAGTLGDGTSALSLGGTNTATTGNLDLTAASATVGSLTVSSNTTTANTITIGSSNTLTVNGNATIGGNPSVAAVTSSVLQVTGAGTLKLGNGSGSLTLNNFTPNNGSNATTALLDASGLATFVANYGNTGTITIGAFTGSTAIGPYGSLILGSDNTLIAGTMQVGINVGGPTGGRSGANRSNGFIKLGTTNKFFVDNISLGGGKTAAPAGTPIDSIIFNNTAGVGQSVKFRGSDGTSPVSTIKIADATLYDSNSGTASFGTMDFTGGSLDMLVTNLQVGLGKSGANSAATTGTFTFNAGTLNATNIILAARGTAASAAATTGNLNVNGTGILTAASIKLGDHSMIGGGTATGNLNINAGTVNMTGDISSGGGVANVNLDGGTLNMAGHSFVAGGTNVLLNAHAGTLSNVGQINGGGANGLTKTTTGVLSLAGTNTYTGPTNINGGTLSVLSAVPGVANVNSGGILAGTGNGGNVTLNGGGTIYPGVSAGDIATLSANSLTVAGGTLSFDFGAGLTSDLFNITGNANFAAGSVISIAMAAPATGLYTVLNAVGTLTLGSMPSVIGPAGNFLYSLNTSDPHKLQINVSIAPVAITWNGAADLTTWNINDKKNWTNGTTNVVYSEPALVTFDDTAPAGATNVTLNTAVAPASVTVNSSTNNYTIAGTGSIGGSAQIMKSGSSTLTLLTNNNYAGPTTLNAGTVQVGNGGTVGSLGTGPVTNNGIIAVNRTDSTTIAGDMSGAGELQQNGTGTLILAGNNSYTTTTINAGTLQIGSGGATGTLGSGPVTNNGALVINRTGTMTASNVIGGPGGLSQTGSVNTTLTGNSTYTGSTTISGGVISVPSLPGIGVPSGVGSGDGGIILDGGTLRWTNTANQNTNRNFSLGPNGGTIDAAPPGNNSVALTLSGTLGFVGVDGPRTLTLTGFDPSSTNFNPSSITGLLVDPTGGALSIVKNGANGWVLNNTGNTFTGPITVNAGLVRTGASPSGDFGPFGSNLVGAATNITVANGAQVRFNNAGLYNNNISIAGVGIPANELGANYGAIMISVPSVELAGTITLTADARISGRGAGGVGGTLSGQITGAHALELGKAGQASTLLVTNITNNWTGDTMISMGTTKVGAASTPTGGVIPHGAGFGNVVVFGGDANNDGTASTLDINGFDTTINGLSSAGDLTKDVVTNSGGTGTLSLGDNNQTASYGGTITGNVSLAKIGTGTQTLGGNNTYFGTTAVNAGTLLVNGMHNTGSDYTVAGGGTLGGNGTISANITVASGGVLSPGVTAGTLHAGGLVDLSGTLKTNLQGNLSSVLDSTSTLNINNGALANFNLLANITTTQFQFANYASPIGGNGNGQFSSVTFSTVTGVPAPTLDHIDYSNNHLTLFVTPQSLRGNFNLDNTVDANDISAMLHALTDLNAYMNGGNPLRVTLSIADMNRLGDFDNLGSATTLSVTNRDIQPMLDYIASVAGGGSAAAVPEPASCLLLGLGGLALLAVRRRFHR